LSATIFYPFLIVHFFHPVPTRRSSDLGHGLAAEGVQRRVFKVGVVDQDDDDLAAHVGLEVVPVTLRRADAVTDEDQRLVLQVDRDRKITRLNSSHMKLSYAIFSLKKKY